MYHPYVARVRVGVCNPEGGDAIDARVGNHGHGFQLRAPGFDMLARVCNWCVCVCISVFKLGGARKGQSAAAPSGVPIVGHLVGNGGGVGVVEHARIVARAGDADAQRIWNGGGINVGAVGAGECSSGATHCRARARSRCTAAPTRSGA